MLVINFVPLNFTSVHQYFEDYTYISNIGYNTDLKLMYNYLCIINSLIWTSEVTL